jgi:segregation and condensation protein B
MEVHELKAAIEAIVFVAEEPVPLLKLKEIFSHESFDKIQSAVNELILDFANSRPGLEIREIAGGYRMTTRPEHHEWIRAYLKTRPAAKLSLAALETLAVVAYRQPITMAEILQIRGVKSSSAMRTLLEKKFITPAGRKKVVGRPILYATTKEFLVHFGLKDIDDLPTLEEFEEMVGSDHSATPATVTTESAIEILPESVAAAPADLISNVPAEPVVEAAPEPATEVPGGD